MKLLFVMRHPAAIRSLGPVLRLLDERGHRVHLAFGGGGPKPAAHRALHQLADELHGLTFGGIPERGGDRDREHVAWSALARRLRKDGDFLRYLEPAYADASALRERAADRADRDARRLARLVRFGGPIATRGLRRALELVERCLEPPPHVVHFLAEQAPDAVVVTHLARDSMQVDFVRAAKRLGIHTAYPVFSWDNLSNKGLVHESPELVLVWNELQANEAVELQSLSRERVRVLGAWSYDHWFEWSPSRTRDEFCRVVGLRADRPLLLYVCSSGFVAPDEVAFVRRWLGELRRHGGAIAEAGVIVRPHPRNAAQWRDVQLDDAQATVWPPHGEEPFEVRSRRNYFDSIYHAAAVVGINTSAQIESAIVGRPVHTLLAEDFRETQQGTIHFRYLNADEFGHLHVGRTMDEHLDQLEASVRGDVTAAARNERFLRTFVRPLGLDVAATPRYVETLEELAARPAPSPVSGPLVAPLVRLALRPLAFRSARRADDKRKGRGRPPADEIKLALRRIRRDEAGTPVVAGPWLGDEVGELLWWIPFLRWVQTATYGLRDRLTVVVREESAPWYAGIGTRLVIEPLKQNGAEAIVLEPSLVERLRDEPVADEKRLAFVPLVPRDSEAVHELPPEVVAVVGEVASRPVVRLDGFDRATQASLLARSRGFVGLWGVEAVIALLVGVPAVVLDVPDSRDLAIVEGFLRDPQFGTLELVPGGRLEEQVDRLLARSALAAV